MRAKRIIQFLFGAMFLVMTVAGGALAAKDWSKDGANSLWAVIVPLLAGLFIVGILQWQIRLMKRAGERIRTNIDAIAKRVFDRPSSVRPGYDMTVTAGAFGAVMTQFEQDLGLTTEGTFNGTRVSVASHASTLGRQIGEMQHTYSHVVVDVLGLARSFRITKQRIGNALTKAIGATKDAKVGDEAFDKMFVIDTDDDFAKAVLTSDVRRRLMELQAQVGTVSQDLGAVGGMGVLLTHHGLAIRWPGDMTPELAIYMRDLLLSMREAMLAFENKKAAQGGAAGYRIVADASPGAEEVPELREEADEIARARRA